MSLSMAQALQQLAAELHITDGEQQQVLRQQTMLAQLLSDRVPAVIEVLAIGAVHRGTAIRPLVPDFLVRFRSGFLQVNPGPQDAALSVLTAALRATQPPPHVALRRDKVPALHVIPVDCFPMNLIPAFDAADLPPNRVLIPIQEQGETTLFPQDPISLRFHTDAADERAAEILRPLIQMAKHWNREAGTPLRPLHLEAMAWSVFAAPPTSLAEGLRVLLTHLANRVLDRLLDPEGEGPDLDSDLSEEQRARISRLLLSTAAKVAKAITFAEADQHDEAHELLRELLGSVYPAAPAPAQELLLDLDVYGAIPDAELPIPAPAARLSLDLKEPRPKPGAPLDFPALAQATARLAANAKAQRRSGGPPIHYLIKGLAPLPVFLHLGMELSPWAGRQTLLNRRKDGTWDSIPVAAAPAQGALFFDVVRGLQLATPSEAQGKVALLVATKGFHFASRAIRDCVASAQEELAGVVELRSEQHEILDAASGPAAAVELIDQCRRLRTWYPAASGVIVFVAGPATLAFLVGRALNPNVIGKVLVANFSPPDYQIAFTLPWQGAIGVVRNRLHIVRLEVAAYRGLRELAIDFDDELTVLIGKNGCGKTSVLRALALMLSQVQDLLDDASPQALAHTDIHSGATEVRLLLHAQIDEDSLVLRRARTRRERTGTQSATDLLALAPVMTRLRKSQASRPLAVYYPVDRARLDVPHKGRKRDAHPAYAGALIQGEANFTALFDWFEREEASENKERLASGNAALRLRSLEAVRQAIKGLLPQVTEPQIVQNPRSMTVRKGGVDLNVDQLSDGEKSLLAMAADLARRLALANPGLHDPLRGSAVVLIDEVELHLYPAWQRDVVRALGRTFPNCQFVMTTHSPQVLSWVKPEQIRLLREEEGQLTVRSVDSSYGLDSNQILTDVMEVSERPAEIEEKLRALFRAIDNGALEEARSRRAALAALIGPNDPELLRAAVYLRHRESPAP